jgi:uncharacterized protein (TIGR02996 family)
MTAELLAQIYADPTDRAARSVYQDWLEQRGDPRARAIALQVKQSQGTSLDRDESSELDAIIAEHWRSWIGPAVALIPPKSRTRFVDGFVSEIALRIESDADLRLAADPVFSTLRWLTCDQADLLVRPCMKLLRTVTGTLRTFTALAELPYELDVHSVYIDAKDWSRDLDARITAARAPVFRNLRSVYVKTRASELDWITRSWIPARVESLMFNRGLIPIATFMPIFRANPRLKFILASLPGTGQISFTRWSQPGGPALEVSLGTDSWDVTLAALDDIDGTGWGLLIKYPAESDETEARRAAMRQRFPSFASVDISEPFESPYEGGL